MYSAFKNRKFFVLLLLLLLVLVLSLIGLLFLWQNFQTNPISGSSFVTRNGNTLMVNGHQFRFAGANIHWLGLVCANGPAAVGLGTNICTYPSQSRVNDVLAAAHVMNATVVRSLTLGVSVGCSKCIEPTLNDFNDQAFNNIDYAIKTAASYNIRLIIPLSANAHYSSGGKHTFTDWRGLRDEDLFYSNPLVIQDFKNYIAHILNHVNQYTGIALKDDPTIMAWETGNELQNATGSWDDSWTEMIAEYIKSIAPHQLVADGHTANAHRDLNASQLQLPSVDLYSSHFYPVSISRMLTSANLAKQYNKGYFIGEYDWTSKYGGDSLANFLSTIKNTESILGDLYWDLYDAGYHGDKYTLHYPGDTPNMQTRVQLLQRHAVAMQEN